MSDTTEELTRLAHQMRDNWDNGGNGWWEALTGMCEAIGRPAPGATPKHSWRCSKCMRWNSTAWDRCRSSYDTGIPCDGRR